MNYRKNIRMCVCQKNCVMCGRCVTRCPEDAISLLNSDMDSAGKEGVRFSLIIDDERCTMCGLCIGSCPTEAMFREKIIMENKNTNQNIIPAQEFTLSVEGRSHLRGSFV